MSDDSPFVRNMFEFENLAVLTVIFRSRINLIGWVVLRPYCEQWIWGVVLTFVRGLVT